MSTNREEAIGLTAQHISRLHSCRFCFPLSAASGWEMTNKYIYRIAVNQFTHRVKDVTRGAATGTLKVDSVFIPFKQFKLVPLIQQGHVDPSFVGRVGDEVFILLCSQG